MKLSNFTYFTRVVTAITFTSMSVSVLAVENDDPNKNDAGTTEKHVDTKGIENTTVALPFPNKTATQNDELTYFGPVIFQATPGNPGDQYPKNLIYDVINPEYGSYRICNEGGCQWVRNFGNDENARLAYEEFIIHRGGN